MNNENILVSILTPTYNRAHLLTRLFESLNNQNNFNFEWVIVDDGSTDNTKDIVDTFKTEKFNLKYITKENGGKHTALNVGINSCSGLLTFIVDSDDWLKTNAIDSIIKIYNKYKDNNRLAGFSFIREYPDGKINVKSNHENEYIGSYNQVRIYEQNIGDMAEVYYTNILKQYSFPEIKDEKFLGEDVVWIEIGKKYDLVFLDYAIYVSDYLSDGLTKNRRKNNIKSCNGCYLTGKSMLSIKLPFKLKVKFNVYLYVYGKFSHKKYKDIRRDTNNKFLLSILHFPSFILYKQWKKKYCS